MTQETEKSLVSEQLFSTPLIRARHPELSKLVVWSPVRTPKTNVKAWLIVKSPAELLQTGGDRFDTLPTLSTYFYILSYADPSPPRPPVPGVLLARVVAHGRISFPHTNGERPR